MTVRIEIDEAGRHILVLPEDVIEEFQLEEGDTAKIDYDDVFMYVDFQS